MRDDLVKIFCEEYTKHWNELQRAKDQTLLATRAEQAKLTKEQSNIIQAIKEGVPAAQIKDELRIISERLEELERLLKAKDETQPLLHPTMARCYRSEIKNLRTCLTNEDTRAEAAEHLRGLIEKIVLTPAPEQKALSIDLYGDLAGILRIASQEPSMRKDTGNKKRLRAVNDNHLPEPSIELVAGVGFEPTTFGL